MVSYLQLLSNQICTSPSCHNHHQSTSSPSLVCIVRALHTGTSEVSDRTLSFLGSSTDNKGMDFSLDENSNTDAISFPGLGNEVDTDVRMNFFTRKVFFVSEYLLFQCL